MFFRTVVFFVLFSVLGVANPPPQNCAQPLQALPGESDQINVETQPDGKIRFAVLYYPRYPDGSPSCTHTKIVVDGIVYGTMGSYWEYSAYEVHARKAKLMLKDSFVKFEMKVSDAELAKIKEIVAKGDATAPIASMCVQGTCKTINRGTSFKVPPPFNQVPALAAMYLGVMRMVNPRRVTSVQFVGRSVVRSFASGDLAIDGVVTTVAAGFIAIAGLAFKVAVVDSVVKLIGPLDDDETKKLRAARRVEP